MRPNTASAIVSRSPSSNSMSSIAFALRGMPRASRSRRASESPSTASIALGPHVRMSATAGPRSSNRSRERSSVTRRAGTGRTRRVTAVTIPKVPSLPTKSDARGKTPRASDSTRPTRSYPHECFRMGRRLERIASRWASISICTRPSPSARPTISFHSAPFTGTSCACSGVPSARRTLRPGTCSLVWPYFTLRYPEALCPIMPPIRHRSWLPGSGANRIPRSARYAFNSARRMPGSTRTSRRSGSNSRMRWNRVVSRTTPGPIAAPDRDVPEARGVMGTSSARWRLTHDPLRVCAVAGRTESQGRVCLPLLARGSATASQISPLPKVPRTRIYATTQQLPEKGLVQILPETPLRSKAVPFATYLHALADDMRSRAKQIDTGLDTLAREFAISAQREPESRGRFEAIYGRKNVRERLLKMYDGATREVIGIGTTKSPGRILGAFMPDLVDKAKQGVRLKYAFCFTPENRDDVRALLKHAEVRHIDFMMPVYMHVFDGKQFLMSHPIPDDDSSS